MVRDPGRGSADRRQPACGLMVDPALLLGRDVLEQAFRIEGVAEPEAGTGVLDNQRGQRCVQRRICLPLRQPGQGDELVGVEAHADHGDPLQGLAGPDGQPVQPRATRPASCRSRLGCPGQFDDCERQAAGDPKCGRASPLRHRAAGRGRGRQRSIEPASAARYGPPWCAGAGWP